MSNSFLKSIFGFLLFPEQNVCPVSNQSNRLIPFSNHEINELYHIRIEWASHHVSFRLIRFNKSQSHCGNHPFTVSSKPPAPPKPPSFVMAYTTPIRITTHFNKEAKAFLLAAVA